MRLSSGWLVAIAVAGCSPAPAPVASSMQNPSNPSAPEGVDPVLAVNIGTSAPDAGPVVYVCPMHPDVTSTEPHACPKCGMILVPKK